MTNNQDMVLVPREVVDFLRGRGPLDGYWFGDERPDKRGRFWWREALSTSTAPATEEAARLIERLRRLSIQLRPDCELLVCQAADMLAAFASQEKVDG